MKKRHAKTAEEFAAELANNSDYQAGLASQEKRAATIELEARPIISELRAAGLAVSSVADLSRIEVPLPATAVEVLTKWLPRVQAVSLKEAIVRSLAHVAEPFDVQPLLTLYKETSSDLLRWAIGNTLAELRPLGARDWVIGALERRDYGRAREMLPLALARIAPSYVANPILLQHMDDMPAHVALGLAESGGAEEAELLRRRAEHETGWVRKELIRAIRRIEKRLRA